jgi:hypothetical protein
VIEKADALLFEGDQAAHHLSARSSVRTRLAASAERDIATAFEWSEREREDLGYRFMAQVDEAIELISEIPGCSLQ